MRRNPARIVVMVVTGVLAACLLALLFGLAARALWNALMPEIFGLPEVSYWQAVGLLVLGHMLFGGGHTFRHKSDSRRLDRGQATQAASSCSTTS